MDNVLGKEHIGEVANSQLCHMVELEVEVYVCRHCKECILLALPHDGARVESRGDIALDRDQIVEIAFC